MKLTKLNKKYQKLQKKHKKTLHSLERHNLKCLLLSKGKGVWDLCQWIHLHFRLVSSFSVHGHPCTFNFQLQLLKALLWNCSTSVINITYSFTYRVFLIVLLPILISGYFVFDMNHIFVKVELKASHELILQTKFTQVKEMFTNCK